MNRSARVSLNDGVTLLPWMTWRYSAIFVIGLFALIVTFMARSLAGDEALEIAIVDSQTSAPVSGAVVLVDGEERFTDADGLVNIPASAKSSTITVSASGYDVWTGPAGNVSLEATASETIAAGNVVPDSVDLGAIGSPGSDDAAPVSTPSTAATAEASTPQVRVQTTEGVILGNGGDPVQGARVVVGDGFAVTGRDGRFSLEVERAGHARVIASGYQERIVEVEPGGNLPIQMTAYQIRALYLNPNISTTDEDIDRLIGIIDETELNAVVIDIKEEIVFYDSEVEFFVDNGVVAPRYDAREVIEKFHERGIYVIARLVVFKDSMVAEQNPDIAVLNNQTGDLWRDDNGVAWVNPMVHLLWEANTDLAYEAAMLGFDEIQFDYVRFPTDGDFSTMDYGLENTQEVREKSIESFLAMAQEKIYPTGAKTSADVFGYTMLVDDDLGIGQNFANLAQYVDYLSPMIYPSHFPDGSIAVDGHPNDFPYETIEISMRLGREKLGGDASRIRPWLQDFSFFDLMPYSDAEVRAQIDASNDIGAAGWMLWDPDNVYHPGALHPEDGSQGAIPLGLGAVIRPGQATPQATPRARRRSSTMAVRAAV